MKQYSKPPGVFMYSNYDMDHSMMEQYSKPPGVFMYSNYDMDHSMMEQYSKPPCIKMEYSRSFKFKIHEKALCDLRFKIFKVRHVTPNSPRRMN